MIVAVRAVRCLQLSIFISHIFYPTSVPYLPEVASYFDIMPWVVIELPIDWLNNGLKGSRAEVNHKGYSTILQRQVDVICWLASMKDKTIALPGLEGECDFVAAALDGVLREVVAEVLWATESGHIFFPCCGDKKKTSRGQESDSMTRLELRIAFNHYFKILLLKQECLQLSSGETQKNDAEEINISF